MHSNHLVSRSVRWSLVVALASLLGGCQFQGDGIEASESRTTGPFRSVHVRAGLEAEIHQGPFSVVVHGDSNILPHVLTTVHGDRLDVEPDVSFEEVRPLRIVVTAPEFDELFLEAGGRLDVVDVVEDELSLRCRAGGDVFASGDVEHLHINQSAGGNIDASALDATDVSMAGSAGGELDVRASHAVEGTIESGSLARVHGDPEIKNVTTKSGGEVVYEE